MGALKIFPNIKFTTKQVRTKVLSEKKRYNGEKEMTPMNDTINAQMISKSSPATTVLYIVIEFRYSSIILIIV